MKWLHTVIPCELEHWTRSVSEVYGVSLPLQRPSVAQVAVGHHPHSKECPAPGVSWEISMCSQCLS